jgi:hypothetical protein
MARKNGIKTVKLQLTVDETTDRIIGNMVGLGIHGPNKAEVASWIIRTWIWENQSKLCNNGITLLKPDDSE